jgi:hypothetical protein
MASMILGGRVSGMKMTLLFFLFASLLFVLTKPVAAHQPRIVSEQTVEIKKPQISQAFYAALKGSPDEYRIRTEKEFNLYVSLLVPALPDIRKDYLIDIYSVGADGQLVQLYKLDGMQDTWEPFYEPFAGDNYYQGPESDNVLPAGDYMIRVSNPDNEGKYVLSVGREESFTLSEVVQTIRRLPAVKSYFEKSPFTAYFNLVGLFMLLSLLLLAAAVFGAYRITTQLLRK